MTVPSTTQVNLPAFFRSLRREGLSDLVALACDRPRLAGVCQSSVPDGPASPRGDEVLPLPHQQLWPCFPQSREVAQMACAVFWKDALSTYRLHTGNHPSPRSLCWSHVSPWGAQRRTLPSSLDLSSCISPPSQGAFPNLPG